MKSGGSLLECIPTELLTYIHLLSLSPSLPNTCHSLKSLFSQTSNHHKATYLKYSHSGSKLLSKSLKYGICTLPVFRRLEELVLRDFEEGKRKEMLKVEELPKRLIKYLKNSTTNLTGGESNFIIDLPFIYYLLSHYQASPNSQKGYWLAKAVVERHLPLVKMLLRFGADPSMKDGYAVLLAIGNKDLSMVKLLLERGGEVEEDRDEVFTFEGEELVEGGEGVGKKRRRSSLGSAEKVKVKKRKMGETNQRCSATPVMLETAAKAKEWEIFKYLVARGAIPSLEVLKHLD